MYFYKERKEIGLNFANQDIMDTYMQRIIYLVGMPRSHKNLSSSSHFTIVALKTLSTWQTAGLDTIFVQIYIDPPPGVPFINKTVFALILPQKGTNFIKPSKLKKKCKKKPLFSESILNLLHFGCNISAPNLK